jgi:hypothetical protein
MGAQSGSVLNVDGLPSIRELRVVEWRQSEKLHLKTISQSPLPIVVASESFLDTVNTNGDAHFRNGAEFESRVNFSENVYMPSPTRTFFGGDTLDSILRGSRKITSANSGILTKALNFSDPFPTDNYIAFVSLDGNNSSVYSATIVTQWTDRITVAVTRISDGLNVDHSTFPFILNALIFYDGRVEILQRLLVNGTAVTNLSL